MRLLYGRAREPGFFTELLGRFAAGGLRAHVARGVGARRWSQVRISPEAQICRNTYFQINFIDRTPRIVIGERVFVGEGSYFSAGDLIELKHDCLVGAGCRFLGAGHSYENPRTPYAQAAIVSYGHIVLGPNVWIGTGATLIGNVSIGFGSVVAAASCVRKSVPPLCMVAGSPAALVKTYDWELGQWSRVPADPGRLGEHLSRHLASLPGEQEFSRQLGTQPR